MGELCFSSIFSLRTCTVYEVVLHIDNDQRSRHIPSFISLFPSFSLSLFCLESRAFRDVGDGGQVNVGGVGGRRRVLSNQISNA